MKLNIFKSALFMAVTAVAFSSCSDNGYWDEFQSEGEQYSMLTTEVSRNYKRANSDEGKDPNFTYVIRRTSADEDSFLPVTVTPPGGSEATKEKNLAYFSFLSADGALVPLTDYYVEVPAMDEEGNPVVDESGNPVMNKVVTIPVKFDKGSYKAEMTLVYVNGYNKIVPSTNYSLKFAEEFKSPGGRNTAVMSVACSIKGKD